MAAKRKTPRDSPLEGANSFGFQLEDLRILSIRCQRFVSPENAPKGTFSARSSIQIPNKMKRDAKTLTVIYEASTVGKKSAEDKSGRLAKCFEITIRAEAHFKVLSHKGLGDIAISDRDARYFISTVQPLMIDRTRQIASEMGYRSVRPPLGSSPDQIKADVS
jgi:hypothetical protein